jgi:hypothetical protein
VALPLRSSSVEEENNPAVGPWQRQLNELGGVELLALLVRPDSASTGNSGLDLSSSWTSWRRRVRANRPNGTSSPTT